VGRYVVDFPAQGFAHHIQRVGDAAVVPIILTLDSHSQVHLCERGQDGLNLADRPKPRVKHRIEPLEDLAVCPGELLDIGPDAEVAPRCRFGEPADLRVPPVDHVDEAVTNVLGVDELARESLGERRGDLSDAHQFDGAHRAGVGSDQGVQHLIEKLADRCRFGLLGRRLQPVLEMALCDGIAQPPDLVYQVSSHRSVLGRGRFVA